MILSVAVAALLGAGAGLYEVLRRRAPRLSDADLKKVPGIGELSSGGVHFHSVSELPPPARRDLKAAFLPGSDFRWVVVGGDGTHPDLDSDEAAETGVVERHRRVTGYMVECVLRVAELYGHILACTDSPDPNEGTFLGSVCLIPPYPSHRLFQLHFLRSVIPLGQPVPKTMGPDIGARFDAYNVVTEVHGRLMGDTPHWYVLNLGVSPAAQGKKVGTRLLKAARAMSETSGERLPLYLECHDGNVPYYEKMGFKVKERFNLVPVIDKPGDDAPYTYNAMVMQVCA